MQNKILILTVLSILGGISRGTLRRELKESNFPKPEKIGKSQYFNSRAVYKWLSQKAGRPVRQGDKLLSSVQLQELFSRSSAWVWLHFQKNEERKAKSVRIRSRPYWLESEVLADNELVKYLSVVGEVGGGA